MQLTCPCCHTRYPLDAANQDEAARDLLAMRGTLPPRIWPVLIAYLGLFRSETRALAWDRALRLAREVAALGADPDRLETALAETVEALRLKSGQPLKNHNYLKRVLESQDRGSRPEGLTSNLEPRTSNLRSKAAQAIAALGIWGEGDWLRLGIAVGLSACVARNLAKTPAADIITLCGDTWYQALKSALTVEELDAPRLRQAFEQLLPKLTEWPQPKQLLEQLPKRPQQTAIRHELNEEDFQRGATMARQLKEGLRK